MRCLSRLTFTLLGLIFLTLGGFLLYTVYLDKPPTQIALLGGASDTAREVQERGELPASIDGQSTDASLLGDTALNPSEMTISEETEISSDSTTRQLDAPSLDGETSSTNEVISSDSQVEVVSIEPHADDGFTTQGTDGEDTDGQGGASIPNLSYEQRLAELEWPRTFREEEPGVVRVTLRALDDGTVQAEAEIEGNTILATPILLTDRYETHTALVTARISAPEFRIESTSSAQQQMTRGQPVSWRWTLTPEETGNFIIALNVEVTWQPKDPNTAQVVGPVHLWGQSVQTQVDRVLGFIAIPEASLAGTILAVLGMLAEIPLVFELAGSVLERRSQRRKDDRRR